MYLAQRMLKKEKHSKNFSRPIVLISILGVALGVCVIVLTISIATGFQNRIGTYVACTSGPTMGSTSPSPSSRLPSAPTRRILTGVHG